jgi:hypothetical protein
MKPGKQVAHERSGSGAMFMRCLCDVYAMFMRCSCDVHAMFMRCSCDVYAMFMRCLCDVHAMFMRCLCDVHAQASPLRSDVSKSLPPGRIHNTQEDLSTSLCVMAHDATCPIEARTLFFILFRNKLLGQRFHSSYPPPCWIFC